MNQISKQVEPTLGTEPEVEVREVKRKEHRKPVEKHDRHPMSTFKTQDIRPIAKKQGHAGKYGWGKVGTGEDGSPILDQNDPNFISDEESPTVEHPSPKMSEFAPALESPKSTTPQSSSEWEQVLKEYLEEGDFEETEKAIEDLNRSETHHLLIKKGLTLAYEHPAYQRELFSKLLSHMCGRLIAQNKIEEGFVCALEAIEDSVIDDPEASHILARFIARAISDEILPPIFLKDLLENPPSELARETLNEASGLIEESSSGEKLAKIWGPGDLTSVKRMKARSREMIEAYLISDDPREVEDLLRQLAAPAFNFQVVRCCVRTAIEKPRYKEKILYLLKYLYRIGMLSHEDIEKGFRWCYEGLSDLKLDVPRAPEFYQDFVEMARSQKLLRGEGVQHLHA